jgi:hypothetical protein
VFLTTIGSYTTADRQFLVAEQPQLSAIASFWMLDSGSRRAEGSITVTYTTVTLCT